jgi:6-pyruvoyltetrahydropterin/6-carboxytetrahydropterin synthase
MSPNAPPKASTTGATTASAIAATTAVTTAATTKIADKAESAAIFSVSQKFSFDAAHTLQRDIEREGSLRVHGHSYYAEVTVSGARDPINGMVLDLGLVRQHIALLRPQLDHRLLDDVPGLGPATLENLCAFIWEALLPNLPGLSQVRVWRDSMGDGCTLGRV